MSYLRCKTGVFLLKKTTAILLLIIHLFNLGGYLVVRQYLVYRSDQFYNEQVKKGLYNIFDVSEIKVPFHSPGIKDSKNFREVSGSVRFQNASYNYVAVRTTRDTLHLLCIPNYETTILAKHNIIWVPGIKDIPVPKKEHVPYAGVLLPAGFIFTFHYAAVEPPVIGLIKSSTAYHYTLVSRHIDIPKQPPQRFC
jgi:hypothetical protein